MLPNSYEFDQYDTNYCNYYPDNFYLCSIQYEKKER